MTPLSWLDSLQGSGIRPGLGRMRALLRALGDPHRQVPAIVVAGTNGKGSTSATLASILTAAGYRTAHYTSPHLVDIRERWTIGGTNITTETLDESIVELQRASERAGIVPTYFEALTLIAFIAFAHAKCDVSVLEVGMGGRLDATNVVRPLAAVITPIGFDHMEYLGNTIRSIAREKAGIIHRGAAVLTTNREPVVLDVIRKRAALFGCRVEVVDPERVTIPAAIPLAGAFQRENVALAVRTAEALCGTFNLVDRDAIARGVAATRWRGRLERFDVRGRTVWVDGCHNEHAVRAVAPFIERMLARPRTLVFGVMGDKDVDSVIERLFPLFDCIVTTEPYPPRSAAAAELAQRAAGLGIEVRALPDPEAALRNAIDSGHGPVFVGGSLYLAGSAIAFLDRETAR
jgi:dihydrofolate synthase/folylpolyglutamate synthase